jgi:hypothetical protein
MSLRNRARHLQRALGLTYQQALARLRQLGPRSAELRHRTGWPLSRCDVLLARELPCAEGERVPREAAEFNPAPPSGSAPQPLEVVSTGGHEEEPLARACAHLMAGCNARSVWLFAPGARTLAWAGGETPLGMPPMVPLVLGLKAPAEETVVELGDQQRALVSPVGRRATLVVSFDGASSLGLVRLRVRAILPELERLLERAAAGQSGTGPGGGDRGGGRGGLPAEMTDSVERWRKN